MPRRPKSIAELRRELAGREKQVNKLLARREKIAARLRKLDSEIRAVGGDIPAPPARGRRGRPRLGRPPARRGRAGKPLVAYVIKALKKAPEGLRVKEVKAAVLKKGYRSTAKDFYGIVATTLRDETRFKKLSRGRYALA